MTYPLWAPKLSLSLSLLPTDSQIALNNHSKTLGQIKQGRLSVMQEKDIYCNVASVGQN